MVLFDGWVTRCSGPNLNKWDLTVVECNYNGLRGLLAEEEVFKSEGNKSGEGWGRLAIDYKGENWLKKGAYGHVLPKSIQYLPSENRKKGTIGTKKSRVDIGQNKGNHTLSVTWGCQYRREEEKF